MIEIESIYKNLRNLQGEGKIPGMIILNEKDFNELKLELNKNYIEEPKKLLGFELLIIPFYLEDKNILKLGEALVLEQKYADFLKEYFDGKRS